SSTLNSLPRTVTLETLPSGFRYDDCSRSTWGASGNGNRLKNVAFTTPRIAAFPPMPSPRVISTTAVNAAFRRIARRAYLSSRQSHSISHLRRIICIMPGMSGSLGLDRGPPEVEQQDDRQGPQADAQQKWPVGQEGLRRVPAAPLLVDEVQVAEDPVQHERHRQIKMTGPELLLNLR